MHKVESLNNVGSLPFHTFNFSDALMSIKSGSKLTRLGWLNDAKLSNLTHHTVEDLESVFVFLVKVSEFVVNRPPLLGIYPEGTKIKYHAHIDMKRKDGVIMPWVPQQDDLLATDWLLIG